MDIPLEETTDDRSKHLKTRFFCGVQIPDPSGGKYYYAKNKCQQCQKWRYDKKSCDAQNAAVAAATCHQVGANEFDKKCMKKNVNKSKNDPFTMVENRKKHRQNSHSIIHFPTSEGVSERANE